MPRTQRAVSRSARCCSCSDAGLLRRGGAARDHSGPEAIRLELGRWLGLALEFEIAADILRTAVAPTWNEIGQLAAIIVLRTALNFFLRKEIEKAAELAASSRA